MARPSWTWLPRLCFLALLLSLPSSAGAQTGTVQWRALEAPGARITLLSGNRDGKVLYATTVAEVNRLDDQTQWQARGVPRRADALYTSSDGGATWRPVTNDLPPAAITALYVDDMGTTWVGLQSRRGEESADGTLWRSPDQGHSWQQVQLDRQNLEIRSIVQDGAGDLLLGALVWADYNESVVYRSADRGVSWGARAITSSKDRPSDLIAALIPHPEDGRVLFATMQNGLLYRSADGGSTWALSGSGEGDEGWKAAQLLFLADRTALLVRGPAAAPAVEGSADAGATWRGMPVRGLGAGVPLAAGVLDGALLLSTDSDTYRSIDRGRSWQALEGVLSGGQVRSFLSSGGALYAGTDYGVFWSRDNGALWRPQSTGIPANGSIAGLLTHEKQPGLVLALVRAVGSTGASFILASRDGGATWSPAGPSAPANVVTAATLDPSTPDIIYAAGWEHVSRTMDGGLTWKTVTLPFSRRRSIVVAPSEPQVVYVAGAPALRTVNGGVSWEPVAEPAIGQQIDAFAVDPGDARHVWAAASSGAFESRDAGRSWSRFGLDGQAVTWLAAAAGGATLYAGIKDGGIARWGANTGDWQAASNGLPGGSTILAFAVDPRTPGLLWAARDGGGLYGSPDGGANWLNAGSTLGENLVGAVTPDYSAQGGVLLGTATAGIWLLENGVPSASISKAAGAVSSGSPAMKAGAGVDARIEVLWPHDFASVSEAKLANIGLRLFAPGSLRPPACGWRPVVTLWGATGTDPATPLKQAEQRAVDGQPFPYWNVNDVDVSAANDPNQKLYFIVKVEGIATATSVWAHAADARTFFPAQDVPSGIAAGSVEAIDSRIQIVWPHDAVGNEKGVAEAPLANVAAALFEHGTRLSVSQNWEPERLTLYGAWNQEVARPLSSTPVVRVRQAGAITYPVWEFNNIPVSRAMDGASRLYLWVEAEGVETYPAIWAHGSDSRTFFPAQDEPVQGCTP